MSMDGGNAIFTLDVGSGTQDFLLYTDKNIRNCIKAVLPSPTRIIAKKIELCESDIYLCGYTMGGGAITRAVKQHIARGYRVFADRRAALTFADNIERVKEMGIEIADSYCACEDVVRIKTCDVDLNLYRSILQDVGFDLPQLYAVAVQDHGYSPHESNRVFRFKMFQKLVERDPSLESFMFRADKIPREFNRMHDAARCILDEVDAEVYVVDTSFAAIAGCSLSAKLPALLINFGNSHVTAAIVNRDWEVAAILEHHTSVLKGRGREYVSEIMSKFVRGEIDNEFILNDGGHGCYIKESIDVRDIVCTGPNAWLGSYREVEGDPMIVGNLGMLKLLEML